MPKTLSDWVREHGGTKTLERILIANNGNAAVKAIRSIRQWSYAQLADEHAVRFIVMASPEDLNANAEYISLADEIVHVPAGASAHNYGNVELIASLAHSSKADAVWAGWGHASENPLLPEALAQLDPPVTWIGPSPSAMRALGDKIASTLIAQSSGVPCVPWSGSGIQLSGDMRPTARQLEQACAISAEEARESAARIGYPLMIKASEGGGGKGIRKVLSEDMVESAFRQVSTEVPGSPIFLMRLASECRHLEVQLLGDMHGNAVALSGRDCSIQRRHQKIMEEGPVVSAPAEVWTRMEDAAVALAKAVDYQCAGTVEYLFDPSDNSFFFLELNPRLQVEHPVTEIICGVNLPSLQLLVCMGVSLQTLPSVSPFLHSPRPKPQCHVLACRITAENPLEGFRPSAGAVHSISFHSSPQVWGYFSIPSQGGRIHEFADSQFGHVFARGSTREEARREMVSALSELEITGDVQHTTAFLRDVLEDHEFVGNRVHTEWLEGAMARGLSGARSSPHLSVVLAAALQAWGLFEEKSEALATACKEGRVLISHFEELLSTEVSLCLDGVAYRCRVSQASPCLLSVSPLPHGCKDEQQCIPVQVHVQPQGLLLVIYGHSFRVQSHTDIQGLWVNIEGHPTLFPVIEDPSNLTAPMSGTLAHYDVPSGTVLSKGDVYGELEAMKMLVPLRVQADGVLHYKANEGDVICAGECIARLEVQGVVADPPTEFNGLFTLPFVTQRVPQLTPEVLVHALQGYPCPLRWLREQSESGLKALEQHVLLLQRFAQLSSDDLAFAELRNAFPESGELIRVLVALQFRERGAAVACLILHSLSQSIPTKLLQSLARLKDRELTMLAQQASILLASPPTPSTTYHPHLRMEMLPDADRLPSPKPVYLFESANRLYARVLLNSDQEEVSSEDTKEAGIAHWERAVAQALDTLQEVPSSHLLPSHNIFVGGSSLQYDTVQHVRTDLLALWTRFSPRLASAHVDHLEVTFSLSSGPCHAFISDPTFSCPSVHVYDCGGQVYRLLVSDPFHTHYWQNRPCSEPYPDMYPLQGRRIKARQTDTLFVYDFCQLFRALHPFKSTFVELVLDNGELKEYGRPAGRNDIGMVAWKATFYDALGSPLHVVIVANDITFQAGSFGEQEDQLYYQASRLARSKQWPFVYLAANSGARIGLSKRLLSVLRVETNESGALDHVYVTSSDLAKLPENLVKTTQLSLDHYRVDAVIGEHGIGIENLMGSGLIAGECSRAYNETFTLSYVTSRTVGIGAYLVRLGQRVIQKQGQPILLTGYQALNKLLGTQVYTSNKQLGGTKVMGPNGVAHKVVQTDKEGVQCILDWLSYVGSRSQLLASPYPAQLIEQQQVSPPTHGRDPREFLSSFFDNNSLMEVLEGWAETVVTGRAKLGGISCGYVSVESRSRCKVVPADPADPLARETCSQQPGQVWQPDSAFKTAQSIRDLDREGLPLFVFANWRGFSGGLRDMFDQVLKFGAMIVDALEGYRAPVFVYLVRQGELRGGAWVVLDSSINPLHMEMYADPESRAGILEPSGIVQVKLKRSAVLEMAHRNDARLKELDAQIQSEQVLREVKEREEEVYSVYHQAALKFADLHDSPHRMLAKGAIKGIVSAQESRRFFYYRMRRKLAVLQLFRDLSAEDVFDLGEFTNLYESVLAGQSGVKLPLGDDKEFCNSALLLRDDVYSAMSKLLSNRRLLNLQESLKQSSAGLLETLKTLSLSLEPADRVKLRSALEKK